jgi:NAD(P)-dependent dehydrogenase (short-subunit alcohol dehydrogenase family)
MTRSLARELLPRRVRVNAVGPGPIATGAEIAVDGGTAQL